MSEWGREYLQRSYEAREEEAEGYLRRLTFRFLTLPFRHQIAIAVSLNVLTDEDRALSDQDLFREISKRAADKGLLAKLWEETEKHHVDPAPFNPFERSNSPE